MSGAGLRMSVLGALLLALLLVASLAPAANTAAHTMTATAAGTAAAPAARPSQVGRWLVDGQGRVLVTHGVNMVYKRPPYAPDATGFGGDDAAFLARNGFTSVRLGLIWRAVEPRPGMYDDSYLRRVRRTVEVLADHGIRTLLDCHQDLYHERFQGEGAPTWAVQDDGLPAQPQAGFPANYFGMPALWRAFDHFWANDPGPGGVGLQNRYAAAWRHVAGFFRGTRGVLGFDLLNEPFPGSDYAGCLQPAGCPQVDARITDFTERVVRAVRQADRHTVVFYEPHLFFNVGVPTYVAPHARQLGFSFHDYCGASALAGSYAGCNVFDPMVFDHADEQAARLHDVPLLTEFGATNDQATLRAVVDLAMQHRTGWQYWAYCGCDDPTTTGPGSTQALVFDPAKAPTGANVDWAKMQALVVPHPTRVAGTPLRYRYDRGSRTFRLRYSAQRAGAVAGTFPAGSLTTVAAPRMAYPTGYRPEVTGARVVSAANARVLRLAMLPGAQVVTLTLRPR